MDDDDDRVGYGRTPKHTRFQKGQSGNPRGRPAGAKGLKADFLAELNERVTIVEDGKSKRIPKGRVVIKALVAKAAKGHVTAADKVITLMIQMFGFEDERHASKALSATDQAIFDQLMQHEHEPHDTAQTTVPSVVERSDDQNDDTAEEEQS